MRQSVIEVLALAVGPVVSVLSFWALMELFVWR